MNRINILMLGEHLCQLQNQSVFVLLILLTLLLLFLVSNVDFVELQGYLERIRIKVRLVLSAKRTELNV